MLHNHATTRCVVCLKAAESRSSEFPPREEDPVSAAGRRLGWLRSLAVFAILSHGIVHLKRIQCRMSLTSKRSLKNHSLTIQREICSQIPHVFMTSNSTLVSWFPARGTCPWGTALRDPVALCVAVMPAGSASICAPVKGGERRSRPPAPSDRRGSGRLRVGPPSAPRARAVRREQMRGLRGACCHLPRESCVLLCLQNPGD